MNRLSTPLHDRLRSAAPRTVLALAIGVRAAVVRCAGQDRSCRGGTGRRACGARSRCADDGRVATEARGRLAYVLAKPRRLGPRDRRWRGRCRRAFTASDIEWPAPRALPVGPLVNHGYEGEVLHLVTITPPADAKPGTAATLAARADWLVCKETCIPDGADLTLTLPVATAAQARRNVGSADRRRARRTAAAAGRVEGRCARRRREDRADIGPAVGRGGCGNAAFLPVRGIAHRAVRRADAGARRGRRLRAHAAGVEPARRRVQAIERRDHGRQRACRRRHYGESGDDRRAADRRRRRGTEAEAGGRAGARRERWRAARRVDQHHALRSDRAGARRRPDPQSDALRVPGAVAEGAVARSAGTRRRAAPARGGPRVRRRRRRHVRRARRCAARAACRGRAARVGLPAAIAGRGDGACDPLLRDRRSTCPACSSSARCATGSGRAAATSACRCVPLRRARRRHRVAVHGAVHGRGARLRADRAGRRDARRVRRARRRHGAAVSCCCRGSPAWRRMLPRPGAWMVRAAASCWRSRCTRPSRGSRGCWARRSTTTR